MNLGQLDELMEVAERVQRRGSGDRHQHDGGGE
jgi:hypothetical protein